MFHLCPHNHQFTDLSWRLLGQYIANNIHLKEIHLDNCNLTNEKMALLFIGLVKSSLSKLDLRGNPFGIDGVRCRIPSELPTSN